MQSVNHHHRLTAHPHGRGAFTIFELLIVLSLVIVIASLSWPSLMRYVQQSFVQTNAEDVRKLVDQGRVSAVEQGMTYQFRYEPNGRKYVLLPSDLVTLPDQTTATNTPNASANGSQIELALVYQLAEGCRFYVPSSLDGTVQITEQLGEPWLQLLANGAFHKDTPWAAPILFHPDGSASDGMVTIMDEKRRYVSVFVRGLTGTVSTSKVEFLPENFGG